MIPDEHILQVSEANEATTEKRIKRMGFFPRRLDVQGPRPRPDFLASDSRGPILVAEVKTIFSGGYLRDRGAHLSTADPNLLNTGPFTHPIDLSRMDENLTDAVRKYRTLLEDEPDYRSVPLLVVFFLEFFADRFRFYPREMRHFPEVSGIVKIVTDHAIRKVARAMSKEELRNRVDTGNMAGLPQNSKDFMLVENTAARLKLPSHFVERCISRDE